METPSSATLLTKRQQIATLAKQCASRPLSSLHHHIDQNWLKEAFRKTRKDGATGTDGQNGHEYGQNLTDNLHDLESRMKSGKYFSPPGKRTWIPKDKNNSRPISICCFEDKVAQRSVQMLLEPIYEEIFYDFSYGFRPEKSPHMALDKLYQSIKSMGGCYLLDADLKSYFDTVQKKHLRDFIQHRMCDGVINRLLGKWLKAGIMEDGLVSYPVDGVPQGGVISPVLSNIYLHYVLDWWFATHVVPRLRGRCFIIRFADDFVLGFSDRSDAERVHAAVQHRFERFGLELNSEKTQLIAFYHPDHPRSEGRVSFDFLGFTHHWEKNRDNYWVLRQHTRKKSLRKGIENVWEECKKRRHHSLADQHKYLCSVLHGHYQYFGLTGNYAHLRRFFNRLRFIWKHWLGRRNRGKNKMNWDRFARILDHFPLPQPKVKHSIYCTAKP